MKKILLAIATVAVCLNLSAQPPMGGGRPGGGGRPPRGESSQRGGDSNQIGITKLPEIEGLTEKQREKLVKTLTDERKAVMKLEGQKHELMMPTDGSDKPKDDEKTMKKVHKIDEKIDKERTKSDQKIRSTLSPEQYAIFKEKRDQVEFRRPDRRRSRPDDRERRSRSDRQGTPPEMPMDNGFDNE